MDPNGDAVVPQSTPTVEMTTTDPPVARTRLDGFTTPDGTIYCRGGGGFSGSWEGQGRDPVFACFSTTAQVPKPTFASCSSGAATFGGAAAVGEGWVATGLCTGGAPFETAGLPTSTVGRQIVSGAVECAIDAADAVSCSYGGQSFRLSSTAVSVSGNDVTG